MREGCIKFIGSLDNKVLERIRGSHSAAECRRYLMVHLEKWLEKQTSDKQQSGNDFIADDSNSTVLEKPTMEKYGWHTQSGFDDEPSGWMYEGGEEAYYEALKKWEGENFIEYPIK